MANVPFERALTTDDPDDPHCQSEWSAGALQNRPLLDVNLEEALRQRPARDEGGTADAAALLVPEDDDCPLAYAFDGLDRSDDTERTVELPSEGNRVEVRAGPDTRLRRPADEISGPVHVDLEPGLTHPTGGQLVGAILPLAAADTVGADTAVDGVKLVEPLVDAHGAIIPRGRDATGHVPVPGTGTTLCQLRV